MTIAFRQGSALTIIGPGGLLHSLCSTIAVRLENGDWGSRFPWVMNGLYGGCLEEGGARAAYEEILTIRNELAQLPPSAVVWDAENPGAIPPWGTDIGAHVTNLAVTFYTTTGRNLVDEIVDGIESQLEFGGPLLVVPFDGKH